MANVLSKRGQGTNALEGMTMADTDMARLWAENDARLGGDFVSLRLGGCKADADGVDGLQSAAGAQFFTVYGVDADGIASAIVDALSPIIRALLSLIHI